MNHRLRLFAGLTICVFLVAGMARIDLPPPTPIHSVNDDYFGIKVPDPYRWLENLEDPQVKAWFKTQADYASAQLDQLLSRDAFKAAITKYVDSLPVAIGDLTRLTGGNYFFIKTLPTDNTGKLYYRKGLGGPDTLLVDTDRFTGPNGEAAAINYYAPSYDSRYVAVGISTGGSEAATIQILDTQTLKEFPETIDRAEYGEIAWLPDSHSFCYCRLQKLATGESDINKYLDSAIYLHQLGTSPDSDTLVMKRGLSPLISMTPVDNPIVIIQPDSDYALGVVEHGVQREETLYVAPLAAIARPGIPWNKICDVENDVTAFSFHHDQLFLLSHKDAPNFKLLKLSLANPDIASATVVLPAGENVNTDFTIAGDAVYVRQMQGAIAHILRLPYDGSAVSQLPLPFDGDAGIEGSDPRDSGVVLGLGSWTRQGQYYEFDPATNAVNPIGLQPMGPYGNRDDITSSEVAAPSYDGTPVPLSIIYRKDMQLNGTNPTAIEAYGAYGLSIDSGFSPSMLAWLDRGGIVAVAHVRGGGELGQDWYKAGFKLTKPNTWRDLIACAQYLIAQKYTSPSQLAIWGGSAGGITMGRAITERPDLFAACDIRAGAVNTLRAENSSNGITNIPEFGSTSTQEGFEDLFAMDAYQHVRDGVAYPGVILTVGMNDPRVVPWEPAKMAARLQAANTGNRPILLRVDYQGGHGIGASKAQRIDQTADMFAFFWSQFGLDGR
jgi:prolyl oligopeptidase